MIIAGIGFKKDVSSEDVLLAIEKAFTYYAQDIKHLAALATSAEKACETALQKSAEILKVPLLTASREDMLSIASHCFTHSSHSLKQTGLPSLSEAAALFCAGHNARLLGARIIHHHITCALAFMAAPNGDLS